MKWLAPLLLLFVPSEASVTEIDVLLVERLKVLEGYRATAYKPIDTEEHYTIGYGHYGPDVAQDMYLTEEEAEELLLKDIAIRMVQIRQRIPNYDKLSLSLQVELMQSWFRGGLSGSPLTIGLINECKFDEAAVEFLRNREYQTTPLIGVKTRMEAVSKALREETTRC